MMDLIYVEWLDSQSPGDPRVWVDRSWVEKHDPMTIASVGWLAKQTPEKITLIPHLDLVDKNPNNYSVAYGVLEIPVVCIVVAHSLTIKRKKLCLVPQPPLPLSIASSTELPDTLEIKPK